VIDLGVVLKRLGNDMELFRDLVAYFERDAPELVERLYRALANSDMASLERHAHKLESLAQNVGAELLAGSARELSRAAEAGDAQNAALAYAKLEACMPDFQSELAVFARPA
jgi:HPt (histidine-containing phosphotransfer) domain-containing protein